MKLLLDFVPNHVAPDHPWVTEHPEYFVRGKCRGCQESTRHPTWRYKGTFTHADGILTFLHGQMFCNSMHFSPSFGKQ